MVWVVVNMMVPFLDPHYNTAPSIQRTPKRNHDFDNHPHVGKLARLEHANWFLKLVMLRWSPLGLSLPRILRAWAGLPKGARPRSHSITGTLHFLVNSESLEWTKRPHVAGVPEKC